MIANRRHTDLYEWGQRTRPLSLSAEIQHRLLPGPQTCEAGAFTLAGWLEPAAGIAGDTFDFSLARDLLHASLTDAMGHGVGRCAQRDPVRGEPPQHSNEGLPLLEQVASANRALVEHATASGLEDFVTGLVGCLDLRTGSFELVNAGHVSPYLARGPASRTSTCRSTCRWGCSQTPRYRGTALLPEPGDRLVRVTNGTLERNAADLHLHRAIADTRSTDPREAVRHLPTSSST